MDTTIAHDGSADEHFRLELPGGPSRLSRAFNRLSSPWTAPDWMLRFHRWAYERSDGRIGHGVGGHPALLLSTTGRRTGQRRCTGLAYGRDGDRLIVAASNSGADRPPAWFCNLQSNPAVELQVGRRHLAARAAIIEASDPDYPRLWKLVNGNINGRLDAYQAKTSRSIALVVLTPTRLAARSVAR